MDDRSLMRLVDFYKLFSDMSRLKILYLLSMEEMCVCDISATLGHESVHRFPPAQDPSQFRLIRYRREGKVVYYSLDDEHIGQVLLQGMLHLFRAVKCMQCHAFYLIYFFKMLGITNSKTL